MTPEVIRRRRLIPWRRVLVALVIAWSGWYASRVLEGLTRADRAAEVRRVPACTSPKWYGDPYCPSDLWCSDGTRWWCVGGLREVER